MALTGNDLFLFSFGNDRVLKRFYKGKNLDIETLYEDVESYGNFRENFAISCMKVSKNDKFLFIASLDGVLKQWSIMGENVVRDFGRIHRFTINCMLVSPGDEVLWTGGGDEQIKMWDISTGELLTDFGMVHIDWVNAMTLT
jgi:WD40 repeat protein